VGAPDLYVVFRFCRCLLLLLRGAAYARTHRQMLVRIVMLI
jgi:hypothetical protein